MTQSHEFDINNGDAEYEYLDNNCGDFNNFSMGPTLGRYQLSPAIPNCTFDDGFSHLDKGLSDDTFRLNNLSPINYFDDEEISLNVSNNIFDEGCRPLELEQFNVVTVPNSSPVQFSNELLMESITSPSQDLPSAFQPMQSTFQTLSQSSPNPFQPLQSTFQTLSQFAFQTLPQNQTHRPVFLFPACPFQHCTSKPSACSSKKSSALERSEKLLEMLCKNRECIEDHPKDSSKKYCCTKCQTRKGNYSKERLSIHPEKAHARCILERCIEMGASDQQIARKKVELMAMYPMFTKKFASGSGSVKVGKKGKLGKRG